MKNIVLLGILSVVFLAVHSCSPTKEQGSIVIYGSNNCHHCLNFKAQLDSVGLVYTFNDVDVSNEQLNAMLQLTKEANITGRILYPVVYVDQREVLVSPKLQQVIDILNSKN